MTPPPDVTEALRRQRAALERALVDFAALERLHDENLGRARASVDEALRQLCVAALPALDDDGALRAASSALALPALEPEAVRAYVERRTKELEARRRALESDACFSTAGLTIATARERARELQDHIAALQSGVRAREADADFRAYREARAQQRWWTFSYYRALGAGERAAERHGGGRDRDALVDNQEREREALRTLERELRSTVDEVRARESLLDEHGLVLAELRSLAERVLDEARAAVGRACELLDEERLLALFDGSALDSCARRISGSRARARYLEALFAHFVDRVRRAALAHMHDLELALGEDAHVGRRPRGETSLEVDAETRARLDELSRARRLYESTAERLLGFSRWDAASPLAGDLWWDAMVGVVLDGSFIDEVTWHRTMRGRRPKALPSDERRSTWERNADHASRALAEAHAAVRAGAVVEGDPDAAAPAAVPAPVELPDHDDE